MAIDVQMPSMTLVRFCSSRGPLFFFAVSLGVISLVMGDAPAAGPVAWLGFALLAAAVVATFVVARARTEASHCVFCRLPVTEVDALIASPNTAICSACAVLAAAIAREHPTADWRHAAEVLPPTTPLGISDAIIDALLAQDGSEHGHRVAATYAFRFQNYAAGERALEGIPETARTSQDWLNLGVAYGRQGKTEQALAATARADDATHGPWKANNEVWFQLLATPDEPHAVTDAAAKQWDARLTAALEELASKKPAGWELVRQCCLGTRAELQRALGAMDESLATLAESEALGLLSADQLLCRARVLHSLGRRAEAKAALTAALGRMNAALPEAERARALLADQSIASATSNAGA